MKKIYQPPTIHTVTINGNGIRLMQGSQNMTYSSTQTISNQNEIMSRESIWDYSLWDEDEVE